LHSRSFGPIRLYPCAQENEHLAPTLSPEHFDVSLGGLIGC